MGTVSTSVRVNPHPVKGLGPQVPGGGSALRDGTVIGKGAKREADSLDPSSSTLTHSQGDGDPLLSLDNQRRPVASLRFFPNLMFHGSMRKIRSLGRWITFLSLEVPGKVKGGL